MNRNLSVPAASDTPTRVRYGVLGFACALSMITYLDRVCFAYASSPLIEVLGLTGVGDLKTAFTAFTVAYAVFEIPTGWLGDVYGPRNTLIRIVLWWSVFTALTGLVGLSFGGLFLGLGVLVAIRLLFGIGEAGAYPNITRALHNWLPFSERGLGQGTVWMAGRLMGGLTPFVWLILVERGHVTWRAAFWVFGGIGLFWCVAFALWFRNHPEEKPEVNAAELTLIQAGRLDTGAGHAHVPWLRLLTNGNLWLLCLMYFCASYGWYFNITYLPNFLEEQYGIGKDEWTGALYKGGPLWMGAMACLVGGVLTDRFIRRTGNRKWGRRLFGVVGHTLCAGCWLACLWTRSSVFLFFLAVSLAAFWSDMTMGSAWAVCQDIGKRYAAIVAGCMNTVGNLGGAAANWVTGTILQQSLVDYAAAKGVSVAALTPADKAAGHLPGYQVNFILFAGVYVIAVLMWLRIDSTQPVVPEAE